MQPQHMCYIHKQACCKSYLWMQTQMATDSRVSTRVFFYCHKIGKSVLNFSAFYISHHLPILYSVSCFFLKKIQLPYLIQVVTLNIIVARTSRLDGTSQLQSRLKKRIIFTLKMEVASSSETPIITNRHGFMLQKT